MLNKNNTLNKNMLNNKMTGTNKAGAGKDGTNTQEKHFNRSFPLEKSEEEVREIMEKYLKEQEFVVSKKYGGQTYRSETANMFGFKYLKWSYKEGNFSLEAWLYGTLNIDWNMNNAGFLAYTIINPYKKSLLALIKTLKKEG